MCVRVRACVCVCACKWLFFLFSWRKVITRNKFLHFLLNVYLNIAVVSYGVYIMKDEYLVGLASASEVFISVGCLVIFPCCFVFVFLL